MREDGGVGAPLRGKKMFPEMSDLPWRCTVCTFVFICIDVEFASSIVPDKENFSNKLYCLYFSMKTYVVVFNEYPQYMYSWRNRKNMWLYLLSGPVFSSKHYTTAVNSCDLKLCRFSSFNFRFSRNS